ncbi:unnamed protein product [Aureobasidium mustum]|uniref:Uncharacterized protein n=1 Tax=Aureobasidium mustum TaxID=2773714 RepID=A0A9N8K2H1_9PEZI|nr:unnamed protein product [Aureobasidium mustum]
MARKPTKTLDENEAAVPNIGDRKGSKDLLEYLEELLLKANILNRILRTNLRAREAPEDESSSAVVESEDDSDVSSEALSEEEQRPQKRRALASSKATESAPVSVEKGKELWRQGVSTGLAPGTQVIIKKPKPRTPGNTPYSDTTIHPNTMLFLKDLKANNDREWLKMHDADYRSSLKDWNTFVESLTEELTKIDDTIPELPLKDVVSGGYWSPDARALAALRTTIDENPQRLKDVLMNDKMRAEFLSGSSTKAAVKSFVKTNAETALKTKPKGYDAGHQDIDLLRLRRFTVGTKLTDAEVLDAQVLRRIADLFSALHPFIACLNRIVLPDPDDEDDEDEDEDDQDEDDEEASGEDEESGEEASDA